MEWRERVGILETPLKSLKAKEVLKAEKIRVYVHADTVFLQERLARALGNERDFEVVMDAAFASEDRKNANAPANAAKEILVLFSSGLVLEALHRIHVWKIAVPELKVLLLGAPAERGRFSAICERRNQRILASGHGGKGTCLCSAWTKHGRSGLQPKAVRDFVSPFRKGSGGISFRGVASRPWLDAAGATTDSSADARADKQGNRQSFFAFRTDRKKSSLPHETQNWGARPAGNCGRVPATRISRLIWSHHFS
jgi:hypothetical protein